MDKVDQPWGETFLATYKQHAESGRANRQRRRERNLARAPERKRRAAEAKDRLAARHADLTAENPSFRIALWPWIEAQARGGDHDAKLVHREEYAAAWTAEREESQALAKAAVRERLKIGYRWRGGSVGGNPAYQKLPFTYVGLVSNEHPILALFVTKTRRAPHLTTGEKKTEAISARSKVLALDDPYVDANKKMRGVLRVELDVVFPSWQALAHAISQEGVPPPNLAVGHVDPEGTVRNPHLLWILENSVPFTDKASKAQQGLYRAVLNALNAALLPIGADEGGISNPHRHKNPLSPQWDRRVLAVKPYSLDELREGLFAACPLDEAKGRLRAAAATQWNQPTQPIQQEHPDPATAAQSNKLFSAVFRFARGCVTRYRDEGYGSRDEFHQKMEDEARRLVPYGRAAEEVAIQTAQSVARWTWANYNPPLPKPPVLPPEERRKRLSAGAKKAAMVKSTDTLAAIVEAIRRLSRGGSTPTQAAVAADIGKDVRTVRRHWPQAIAVIEEPDISLPYDKKDNHGAAQLPVQSTQGVEMINAVAGHLKADEGLQSPSPITNGVACEGHALSTEEAILKPDPGTEVIPAPTSTLVRGDVSISSAMMKLSVGQAAPIEDGHFGRCTNVIASHTAAAEASLADKAIIQTSAGGPFRD